MNAALGPRREGKNARIQKAMFGALSLIAKRCGLDLEVVGASVFRVDRRVRLSKRPPFVKRQDLLHRPPLFRFRLSDHPQASTVTWTRGKGAIGQAWRTRTHAHVDWHPIARRHGSRGPITRQRFDSLPAGTRAGFTYEEFVGIVGKYGEILAVPIMSDGGAKILGVIAIDRPYVETDPTPKLDRPDVLAWVSTAATSISADL